MGDAGRLLEFVPALSLGPSGQQIVGRLYAGLDQLLSIGQTNPFDIFDLHPTPPRSTRPHMAYLSRPLITRPVRGVVRLGATHSRAILNATAARAPRFRGMFALGANPPWSWPIVVAVARTS